MSRRVRRAAYIPISEERGITPQLLNKKRPPDSTERALDRNQNNNAIALFSYLAVRPTWLHNRDHRFINPDQWLR